METGGVVGAGVALSWAKVAVLMISTAAVRMNVRISIGLFDGEGWQGWSLIFHVIGMVLHLKVASKIVKEPG